MSEFYFCPACQSWQARWSWHPCALEFLARREPCRRCDGREEEDADEADDLSHDFDLGGEG